MEALSIHNLPSCNNHNYYLGKAGLCNTNMAEVKPWLNPPRDWPGSLPEYALYWAHFRLGLVEGVHFDYQTNFIGGRKQKGGAVLDFVEHDVNIGIRIQGIYYHLHSGGDVRAQDELQKIALEGRGIRVVDVSDTDCLNSPVPTLRRAREGVGSARFN